MASQSSSNGSCQQDTVPNFTACCEEKKENLDACTGHLTCDETAHTTTVGSKSPIDATRSLAALTTKFFGKAVLSTCRLLLDHPDISCFVARAICVDGVGISCLSERVANVDTDNQEACDGYC